MKAPADSSMPVNQFGIPKERFPCELCNRSYSKVVLLKQHMEAAHSSNEEKFLCHLCPRTFAAQHQLKHHYKYSHEPRSFKCSHAGCEKAFRFEQQFKDHMQKHTGEKNYQCPNCQLRVMSDNALRSHIQAHHLGWRYRCVYPGCDLDYMHKQDLSKHLSLHHTKDPDLLKIYRTMVKD